MWKCDKENVKLQLVRYVANPVNGFKDAFLKVTYTDGKDTDQRLWNNDALQSEDGIKSLIVLTAWMIKNKYGFCPLIDIEGDNGELMVHLYVKENSYSITKKTVVEVDKLPKCIAQAVNNIWKELEDVYAKDDYLDI